MAEKNCAVHFYVGIGTLRRKTVDLLSAYLTPLLAEVARRSRVRFIIISIMGTLDFIEKEQLTGIFFLKVEKNRTRDASR
jgi:hypothetical protein